MPNATEKELKTQAHLVELVETRTGLSLKEIATKIGLKERTLYKGKQKLVKLSNAVHKHLQQLAEAEASQRLLEPSSPPYNKSKKHAKLIDQINYICQHANEEQLQLFHATVDVHYKQAVQLNKKSTKKK